MGPTVRPQRGEGCASNIYSLCGRPCDREPQKARSTLFDLPAEDLTPAAHLIPVHPAMAIPNLEAVVRRVSLTSRRSSASAAQVPQQRGQPCPSPIAHHPTEPGRLRSQRQRRGRWSKRSIDAVWASRPLSLSGPAARRTRAPCAVSCRLLHPTPDAASDAARFCRPPQSHSPWPRYGHASLRQACKRLSAEPQAIPSPAATIPAAASPVESY